MKISDIPTAVNYATVQSSRLTQAAPVRSTGRRAEPVPVPPGGVRLASGLVVTKTENSDPNVARLITSSLAASDNDYTKQDAIMKEWSRRHPLNIFDSSTWKTSIIHPSDLEEFEKRLQTEGLRDGVNWGRLNFDMRGIGFGNPSSTVSLSTILGPGDLSRKVDYLASRYAALEDKIKNTTTGDDRAEQMKRLDEVFHNAMDEIAGSYSGFVGSFLEKNGVDGEKGKIYDSVVSGVEGKVDVYRKALSGNFELESLKGTKDAWLLDDDAYVASVLRKGTAPAASAARAPYSLDDMEALGQYGSGLSAMDENKNTYSIDEARIGLDLSMLAMKTDELKKHGGVGSAMSGLLQRTLDGFTNAFLDRMDSELAAARKQPLIAADRKGYAALDRSVIRDVYNRTMEEYRASGDAMRALLKGAEFGKAKASALGSSGTYRYNNSTGYWGDFFEKKSKNNPLDAWLYGYEDKASTFQKYQAGWLDFKDSLDCGQPRMNLLLLPVDRYLASGNMLSRSV